MNADQSDEGKIARKEIGATLLDSLYVRTAPSFFESLNFGTANSKAKQLVEITKLLDFEIYKGDDDEKLYRIFYKVFTIFASKQLNYYLEKQEKNNNKVYKLCKRQIDNYFLENEQSIRNNKELKPYITGENKLVDCVHNGYLMTDTGIVHFYDTTERKDVYITLILEGSSRFIVTFILTRHKPSGTEIEDLLKNFYACIPDKSRQIILHSDAAGENSSDVVRKFCLKHNIKVSYSETQHGNQLCELTNYILWKELGKIKFIRKQKGKEKNKNTKQKEKNKEKINKDINYEINNINENIIEIIDNDIEETDEKNNETIDNNIEKTNKDKTKTNQKKEKEEQEESFFDLSYMAQKTLVWYVIAKINRKKGRNSYVLFLNSSSEEAYQAGCLYRYFHDKVIIAKRYSDKGHIIEIWQELKIMLFRLIKNQERLTSEKSLPISFAITPKKLEERGIPTELDADWLYKQKEETRIKYDLTNKLLKKESKDILSFLLIWAQTDEAKSLSDYQKLLLQINVLNSLKLDENLNKSEEIKDIALQIVKQNNEAKEENKELKKLLEDSKKSIEKQQKELQELKEIHEKEITERKVKEDLSKKRKENRLKKSKPKYGIKPEDMDTILSCVKSDNKYVYHRNRIAHVILKYTGMRVSNLKYVKVSDLRNFFNYETMSIPMIKTTSGQKLDYAVTKESASFLVEKVKHDWIELQKLLIEKNINIFKEDDPNELKESEIWGTKTITREALNKSLNKELREASKILKRRITTHSYRIGVAQIGAEHDLIATQMTLNHKHASTTMGYGKVDLTTKRKKTFMTKVNNPIKDTELLEANEINLTKNKRKEKT